MVNLYQINYYDLDLNPGSGSGKGLAEFGRLNDDFGN
jgi:hypothetical protein